MAVRNTVDEPMGKESKSWLAVFMRELFQLGVYKRSQGRIARQITCAVIWAAVAIMAWRIWSTLGGGHWRFLICGLLLPIGLWVGYRLVNLPQFADFLIAVEAEMNKVSWPARGELVRSSFVVIFVIFSLAAVLFGYDLIWRQFFVLIGVRS
jgi:preprotein translocase subunit SecE